MKASIILSIHIPTCLCRFSSEMFFTMTHLHWFSKNDNFRDSLGWVCEFLCNNGDNGCDGKSGRLMTRRRQVEGASGKPGMFNFLPGWYSPYNSSLSCAWLYIVLCICVLFYSKKH